MLRAIFITIFILSALLFGESKLKELMQKAKSGDVEAIYQLGYSYENGLGVQADKKKAIAFYKKAAQLGSDDAKLSLELIDLDDDLQRAKSLSNKVVINKKIRGLTTVLTKSDLKAIIKDAKKGDKEALFALAVMYENGVSPLKQDDKKALLLFRKAAKAGSKKALNVLNLRASLKSE